MLKGKIAIAFSSNWINKEVYLNNINCKDKIYFILNKNELEYDFLLSHRIKYVFFPHWSYIIPAKIYENFTCVIFHMTDLPYGRGGSPLQNLIVRKIYKTKISALKCVKEIDGGPVYLKKELDLSGKAEEIYKRASFVIIDMINEIVDGDIKAKPQTGEATFFKRRNPSQSNMVGVSNLVTLYDHIRMLDAKDYPKAFIELDNFRYEFTNAKIIGNEVQASVRIMLKED